MGKPISIGRVFGSLTTIQRVPSDKFGRSNWLCRCVCGNEIVVNGTYLTMGQTTSCGCQKKVYQRTCIHCGRTFTTTRHNRLLCSEACRQERQEMLNRAKLGLPPLDELPKNHCLWCESLCNSDFCSDFCRDCYADYHRKPNYWHPEKNEVFGYGERHKYAATVTVPEGLISYKERMKNVK